MAEQQPNPAPDKEKAEGSRRTVDEALQNVEADEQRKDEAGGEAGTGITNLSPEEERQEQERVPPRGHARKDGAGGQRGDAESDRS